MRAILWNLFLLGVLLVSLYVGSSNLAEPLSMGDLADYSPVVEMAGKSLNPENTEEPVASFSWSGSSMTPAPTTAVTTMPSFTGVSATSAAATAAATVSAPAASPSPFPTTLTTSPAPK